MSLTNKNEFIDTLVITIFTFFVFRFVSHDNGGNFHRNLLFPISGQNTSNG